MFLTIKVVIQTFPHNVLVVWEISRDKRLCGCDKQKILVPNPGIKISKNPRPMLEEKPNIQNIPDDKQCREFDSPTCIQPNFGIGNNMQIITIGINYKSNRIFEVIFEIYKIPYLECMKNDEIYKRDNSILMYTYSEV